MTRNVAASYPVPSPAEWQRLALHALHDLRLAGVDISLIRGVNPFVIHLVDQYERQRLTDCHVRASIRRAQFIEDGGPCVTCGNPLDDHTHDGLVKCWQASGRTEKGATS